MKKFLSSTRGQLLIALFFAVTVIAIYQFGLAGLVATGSLFAFGVVTTDDTGAAKAGIPATNSRAIQRIGPVRITVPLTAVTNDIIQAIPVKKGWKVYSYFAKMVTAGVGDAITMDVGITGVAATGMDSAVTLTGAAGATIQSALADTWPAANGYYVAASDTVDILLHTITNMTVAPVFDMWIYVEDVDADYTT